MTSWDRQRTTWCGVDGGSARLPPPGNRQSASINGAFQDGCQLTSDLVDRALPVIRLTNHSTSTAKGTTDTRA
ncbi:MAG: hypothetical protein DLM65_03820 [Candidatus Aeolococcus gillhamiae]|uniref:Uncharacterized protein n=1 Tax=Candidatus Aeolococcus gillhamiae TaxID=3127015 RepID=A0A2W5ZAN7_9BACT|nr:MAG: hypothetical protein DLM65_03820 [Candidatus Dormibacter sp. RRmetagenome_bin12]